MLESINLEILDFYPLMLESINLEILDFYPLMLESINLEILEYIYPIMLESIDPYCWGLTYCLCYAGVILPLSLIEPHRLGVY